MPNIPLPRRGAKVDRTLDLNAGAANAARVIKAKPGCLIACYVTNRATSTRWLKFYDRVSATTGTHTPFMTIGIPGNSSDNILVALAAGGVGIQFGTGICLSGTTGFADADTGAPAANDLIVNTVYI